jgi:DNA-binding NarL/FixJ family response regulator
MTDSQSIGILSVDDPLLREGIAAVIDSEPDMTIVARVSTAVDGIQAFRKHRPDVTLMDLRRPDISGVKALWR